MSTQVIGLEDISTVSLECRDLTHQWSWITDKNFVVSRNKIKQVTRLLACLRCGSEREDVLEVPTFYLLKRQYSYSDEFLMYGMPRVKKDEVRVEYFKRTAPHIFNKVEKDASWVTV